MWPRSAASPRVATRRAIRGEHPETRSASLSRGCRVLSTASPANPHLPVQARERTARNRQNATSLLTTPYQGEGSTRPFIFAQSPFTRALGGNASASLGRIAHYPCPLLCTCDISQEKASARAPRLHPIIISRALQAKAPTRVHRPCPNLLLKRSASKAHFPPFKPSAQGLCKASRLHPPWSILLLKGSARLQQGFTPLIQTFFLRALQGSSKASLSLFKPSS